MFQKRYRFSRMLSRHLCAVVTMLCLVPIVSAQTTIILPDDIDKIIAEMTLQQKVGQLFMVSFYGAPMNDAARQLLTDWQPGGVVLLPSNLGTPQEITALTNDIQQTLVAQSAPPALIAVDQEGGIIARLRDGFTNFPIPMLWTATQEPNYAYQVGQAMAVELQAVGINMNLAPVADVHTNADNPIIGRRAFGSDAEQVAPYVGAFIRGLQDTGVFAVAKHFPGHGDTAQDSHLDLPILAHTRERFETLEWVPFRAAQDADVATIMTGHLVAPALDAENLPASLSSVMVQNILRDEWNYQGIIMTDALDMDAIDTRYSPADAAYQALNAGHDMILLGAHVAPETFRQAMQGIVNAVQRGDMSESRLDESVRRILLAKANFGLLDWQPLSEQDTASRLPLESHAELVQNLFREGITLVRDVAGLLPLQGDVLFVYPASRFTLWQACQQEALASNIRLMPLAVSDYADEAIRQSASSSSADAIIVFTEDAVHGIAQMDFVRRLPPEKTILIALQSTDDVWLLEDVSTAIAAYSPIFSVHEPLCMALMQADFRGQFTGLR
jgi:beta-N-acetylhexosaminidase